jgi:hypothetical protein
MMDDDEAKIHTYQPIYIYITTLARVIHCFRTPFRLSIADLMAWDEKEKGQINKKGTRRKIMLLLTKRGAKVKQTKIIFFLHFFTC